MNYFGSTLPQIVDFSAFWGRDADLVLKIYDIQLFGLQVFAPMYFSTENRKSFMGLNHLPMGAVSDKIASLASLQVRPKFEKTIPKVYDVCYGIIQSKRIRKIYCNAGRHWMDAKQEGKELKN